VLICAMKRIIKSKKRLPMNEHVDALFQNQT